MTKKEFLENIEKIKNCKCNILFPCEKCHELAKKGLTNK